MRMKEIKLIYIFRVNFYMAFPKNISQFLFLKKMDLKKNGTTLQKRLMPSTPPED